MTDSAEMALTEEPFSIWRKIVLDLKKGGVITSVTEYTSLPGDPVEYTHRWLEVEYIQSDDDIWIPTASTETSGIFSKKEIRKFEYKNVKVNHFDPDKEIEKFRIQFPKSLHLFDRRTKTHALVGRDGYEAIEKGSKFKRSLLGKPAPELTGIKEWKNGGPVKLSELRGKVVLLDFWGYWCGPCNRIMPNLMELHDTFKDRGLVIIAIHDFSVDSIEEMDAKLGETRKKLWAGRDIPFLLGLDSGETIADYGIVGWPTTLLIDRDGKVLEDVEVDDENFKKKLSELLDSNKSSVEVDGGSDSVTGR